MTKPAISPAYREPSGKKQRDTRKQIEAAQKAAAEKQRAITYGQPHRRGNSDQRCSTSWGRFCLRFRLARELFDAGERYGDLYRRWMLVVGGRAVEGHVAGPWTGSEPTPEMINRITDQLTDVEQMLRRVSPRAYPLMRHMIIDCPTEGPPSLGKAECDVVIEAAQVLANHFYARPLQGNPFS